MADDERTPDEMEDGGLSELKGDNPSDRGEATKPASTILRQEIEVGTEQLERPASGLLLSAVSAGLDIGFGPLMVAAVISMVAAESFGGRLGMALVYSIGFVIVILGRSELFTEHTTLAVLPLLSGRTSLRCVARLWGLVYLGNMIGVLIFSAVAAPLGLGLGLFKAEHLEKMAHHLTEHGSWVVFGSAIAAGWMMGLVSWLVTAARDSVGQIFIIVLVTGSIAFLGFHHSIAGSTEVLLAVFGAGLPFTEWLRFLALATAGNAFGGVVLVALLKYSHVARASR